MATYTVHQAKTQLSKLIERATGGEEVIIARGSVPAVRIVPVCTTAAKRSFGAYRGEIEVTESFFDPLPQSDLDAWDGGKATKPRARRRKR